MADETELPQFFVVVPPGLEELAAQELHSKIPGLEIASREKGGLSVRAPMAVGLALNLYLKIPSAVLLRIAEFKCRDLPKLYQKTSNIKWGQYLLGRDFVLSVASSKSRLLNEKKIEKSVAEGIARHFEKQPPKKSEVTFAFEIKVRFFNDICTMSLDLSGEPLFKRGYKTLKATAPLRENLAAGLFYALRMSLGEFDTLMDPMCGTGTFLIEAHEFHRKQTHREFAFQKKAAWVATDIQSSKPLVTRFYGFDKNETHLQSLRESLQPLLGKEEMSSQWQLFARDVFAPELTPVVGSRLAIICNPPYGERLRLPAPPGPYYEGLLARVFAYNPVGAGIILPKRYSALVKNQFSSYKVAHTVVFENGGIPVEFRIYKR